MSKEPKKYVKGQWTGAGIAFGVAIDNGGLGIVLGLAVGVALDVKVQKKEK